ncbi:hypothetical protein GF325_10040 [Candidatus Bathyarchaeota archaeon]|nr:hypothetical protein [Candidatus Bathyarchaeota archaeon]
MKDIGTLRGVFSFTVTRPGVKVIIKCTLIIRGNSHGGDLPNHWIPPDQEKRRSMNQVDERH